MLQVGEHSFAETKYLGCNIGVITTPDGPIVIDTPALPQDAIDLKTQLRKLTKRRIINLIYTHEHFDHVIGCEHLIRKGIVAHHATISEIDYLSTNLGTEINRFFPDLYRQYHDVFDKVRLITPQITFTTEMMLYKGNLTLELRHIGGHSPASIIVYVKQDRILFCGDNVNLGMPLVTRYSRFDEWIAALRLIEGMEVTKIVPGHGEICDKEIVRATRVYFETMRKRVKQLVKAGASGEQVTAKISLYDVLPVPYSEMLQPQIQSTVAQMYDEVSKEEE